VRDRGSGALRPAREAHLLPREHRNRVRVPVPVAPPGLLRRRGQGHLPETVLNLRTTTSQRCAAVPRRTRI